MSSPISGQPREDFAVPSLDVLRGIMPVLVLLSHAAIWTGAISSLKAVFLAGGLAVDVFIFISGFLMLWHYLHREHREAWTSGRTWRRFWIRRFFRIAPLYWFILTVVYLTLPSLNAWIEECHRLYPPPWIGREVDPSRVDGAIGVVNVLSHYLFLFGFLPRFSSNNPLPDWSIGLEMQFYLAFPFIAIFIRKAGWLVATVLLSGLWMAAMNRIGVGLLSESGDWGWFPMPTFLPLRIGVFLCGMLAAEALFRRVRTRECAGFALGSLALAAVHNKWLVVPLLGFYVWELVNRIEARGRQFEFLVGLGRSILASRPVAFIANCSYGIYLWHVPVQLAVMKILLDWGWLSGLSPITRWALLSSACLPIVYLFSWLSYRWIEKPGINLGKHLLARKEPVRT